MRSEHCCELLCAYTGWAVQLQWQTQLETGRSRAVVSVGWRRAWAERLLWEVGGSLANNTATAANSEPSNISECGPYKYVVQGYWYELCCTFSLMAVQQHTADASCVGGSWVREGTTETSSSFHLHLRSLHPRKQCSSCTSATFTTNVFSLPSLQGRRQGTCARLTVAAMDRRYAAW